MTLIEALNSRDLSAYFAHTVHDFEITIHGGDGEREVVAGRRALRLFFEDFFAQWTELSYEFLEGPEEIAGLVFSRDRWSGRSQDGDERTVTQYYAVGSFRGHLCARMDAFTDRDEALRHIATSTAQGADG